MSRFRVWMVAAALPALVLAGGCESSSDTGNTGDGDGAVCEPASLTIGGDAPEGCDLLVEPGSTAQYDLQAAFIAASPGQTVCLAAGTFDLDTELLLTTPGVTVRGIDREQTVLEFATQDLGANGLHVRADGVTLEDLTVRNTAGDGIRATDVAAIVFRNVAVIWDADESDDNGAYGLYPVGCTGVRIEGCLVKGARDAGIYVGQSSDILVADSEAWGNVAGIEVENSVDAEVRDNHAHDNTAGILIFNLPGLPIQGGARTRVHHNTIEDNNVPNFAPGGVVSMVPSGIGVVVLATDDNEIHDNTITGNSSTGVILLAYLDFIFGEYDDPAFDAYTTGNWIHDNTFADNGTDPQGLIKNVVQLPLPMPDVIWAGCLDPELPVPTESVQCLSDNDATFANMNFCNSFDEATEDVATVTCTRESLPAQDPPEGIDVSALPAVAEHSPCDALSGHGLFTGELADQAPAEGVVAYDVTADLWSDHAAKDRFIRLPEGTTVGFSAEGGWEWPDGTVVVKTFSLPADLREPAGARRLLETRLLTKTATGWVPDVYLWNDAQTDAVWAPGGARVEVAYADLDGTDRTESYSVPNTEQCKTCHAGEGAFSLLGPFTAQMNHHTQLADLAAGGLFTSDPPASAELPALVDPFDAEAPLADRARAYLHANCAHCHRSDGAAGASGLFLTWDETDDSRLGVCKQPAAAGAGNGGLEHDVVPGVPDESILVFRMSSTEPAIKMPELPNRLVDEAGVDLVTEWIAAMDPVDCE